MMCCCGATPGTAQQPAQPACHTLQAGEPPCHGRCTPAGHQGDPTTLANWTPPMQAHAAGVPSWPTSTVPPHLCSAALQRQPLCKGQQDLCLLCLHVPRIPGVWAAAVAVLPQQVGLWAATGVGRGLAVPVQAGSQNISSETSAVILHSSALRACAAAQRACICCGRVPAHGEPSSAHQAGGDVHRCSPCLPPASALLHRGSGSLGQLRQPLQVLSLSLQVQKFCFLQAAGTG